MSLPADTFEAISAAGVAATNSEDYVLDSSMPDLVVRVVPNSYRVDTFDLTKYRPAPLRRVGHPVFHEPASFGAYVAAQKVVGTMLYADVTGGRGGAQMTAVLDGHEPTEVGGTAGWSEHRASLVLRETNPWTRWMKYSGVEQTPEDFAEFLEDNALDVRDPDAATLIEVARNIEVHKDVSFQSVTRPTSGGRRLHYDETVTARVGESGAIDVPETLTLALAPWEGVDPFAVTAQFKFRLRAGRLHLSYTLVRPEAVLETAFFGMPATDTTEAVPGVLTVVESATGLTALHGRP